MPGAITGFSLERLLGVYFSKDAHIHCLDKRCKGILAVTGHAERSGLQDLRICPAGFGLRKF